VLKLIRTKLSERLTEQRTWCLHTPERGFIHVDFFFFFLVGVLSKGLTE